VADEEGESLRDRLSRQSEEALGKLASDLLENPLVNSAVTRAFSAREKAVHAQEAAMGALNLPSAADIDRLTRRLRTVGTRLEGIEEALDRLQDGVDRLSERLESASRSSEPGIADRVAAIEGQLSKLVNDVGHVSDAIDARPTQVPREQERLAMDGEPPKPKAKPARKRAAAKKRAPS
jgi:chromosome segregation ATPase